MPLSPEKELQRRVSKILLEAPSAGIRLRRPVGFLSPGYPQQLLHSRGSHTAQDSAEKGRPVFFREFSFKQGMGFIEPVEPKHLQGFTVSTSEIYFFLFVKVAS